MQVNKFSWGTVLVCAFLTRCNQHDTLTDAQKKEVDGIVRSVLDNVLETEPSKFITAIDKAVQQQQREAAQKVEQNATESQQKFWDSKLVIGQTSAKTRLAVFIDPLDPISQRFYSEVMIPLVKERSDVCFFLIPVSIHGEQEENPSAPHSLDAAKAIIAAVWQSPEKALALWKKMPTIHNEFPKTLLFKYAAEAGLDSDRLERDMNSEPAKIELMNNGQLAVSIGIPLQLPVILVRTEDGTLNLIPPFVKERLVLVLNAIQQGKPWQSVLPEANADAPAAAPKSEEPAPSHENGSTKGADSSATKGKGETKDKDDSKSKGDSKTPRKK
jgi:hypothetical protein